jgi:hypothetical protein
MNHNSEIFGTCKFIAKPVLPAYGLKRLASPRCPVKFLPKSFSTNGLPMKVQSASQGSISSTENLL